MADDSNWRRQLLQGRIVSLIALPFLLTAIILIFLPGEHDFHALGMGLGWIGLILVYKGSMDIRAAIKKKNLQ